GGPYGNIISGNQLDGVLIDASSDVTVEHNQIGGASGGNAYDGVHIVGGSSDVNLYTNIITENELGDGVRVQDSTYVMIGGDDTEGNTIQDNAMDGVAVTGSSYGVTIWSNSIYNNGELGIDLNDDQVTPNDDGALDADSGPNGFQNFPEITWVALSSSFRVDLYSTPNTAFLFQFFFSPDPDPSVYAEGENG